MDIKNLVDSFKSSPEDEMRSFILSFAREFNLDTGHVLPTKPLLPRTFNLNPKQKDALIPAIESLTKEGVFEEKEGQYFLTKTGRDVLYP